MEAKEVWHSHCIEVLLLNESEIGYEEMGLTSVIYMK